MKLIDAERIINDHMRELYNKPGSSKYHSNKKGGLIKHLNNVFNVAKNQFPTDETLQALALLHDIGKGRVYDIDNEGIRFISDVDHIVHTLNMIEESGYELPSNEKDAIIKHHGGWTKPNNIFMDELAIRLHYCDHIATVREKDN